jgi:hypothetical protein
MFLQNHFIRQSQPPYFDRNRLAIAKTVVEQVFCTQNSRLAARRQEIRSAPSLEILQGPVGEKAGQLGDFIAQSGDYTATVWIDR